MNIWTIFFIALGLSMDAFAVSITSGIIIKKPNFKHAIKIGLFFGVFQAIMPYIGWLLGRQFSDFLNQIDHWIVFILLSFIGVKMISEARKNKGNNKEYIKRTDRRKTNPLNNIVLLTLAVATSVDALAVGISFAFLNVSIYISMIIIGLVTFIFSIIGVYIGNLSGDLLKNKAETIGGLILIIIGIKILFEHLNMS